MFCQCDFFGINPVCMRKIHFRGNRSEIRGEISVLDQHILPPSCHYLLYWSKVSINSECGGAVWTWSCAASAAAGKRTGYAPLRIWPTRETHQVPAADTLRNRNKMCLRTRRRSECGSGSDNSMLGFCLKVPSFTRCFSVFTRCAVHNFLETPVEIRQISESAFRRRFRGGFVGFV